MPPGDTTLDPANYRQAAVRDLAWACFSPTLVSSQALSPALANARFALTPERVRWLESLDRSPDPLLRHLQQRPVRRLGLYFESLWQFFLARDAAVELLAHNLPVRSESRTIGEFDCLYYCRERRRPVHLELAVKFYLGQAGRWIGPDSRDRLDIKLDRLSQHQMRLGDHPEGRRVLAEHGIRDPLREMELKGGLFQPAPPQPVPAYCEDQPQGNIWLRITQLPSFLMSGGLRSGGPRPGGLRSGGPRPGGPRPGGAASYCILPRLGWLAGEYRCAASARLSPDALQATLDEHFASGGRARLVAALDAAGSPCNRFFVTPRSWPEQR